MQFLKEYVISIITVSVLSVIFEIILPKKTFGKYISVITGLVVMMVIISPVKNILGDGKMFVIEGEAAQEEQNASQNNFLVAEEFTKRLEEKIAEALLEKTGEKTEVTVLLELTEHGEIAEIKKVTLNPFSEKSAEIIEEEFGIDAEKTGGKADGD